jgi:hypothetical protein
MASLEFGTRAGQVSTAGTDGYRSPEKLRYRPLDVRSDMYSLGATFRRSNATFPTSPRADGFPNQRFAQELMRRNVGERPTPTHMLMLDFVADTPWSEAEEASARETIAKVVSQLKTQAVRADAQEQAHAGFKGQYEAIIGKLIALGEPDTLPGRLKLLGPRQELSDLLRSMKALDNPLKSADLNVLMQEAARDIEMIEGLVAEIADECFEAVADHLGYMASQRAPDDLEAFGKIRQDLLELKGLATEVAGNWGGLQVVDKFVTKAIAHIDGQVVAAVGAQFETAQHAAQSSLQGASTPAKLPLLRQPRQELESVRRQIAAMAGTPCFDALQTFDAEAAELIERIDEEILAIGRDAIAQARKAIELLLAKLLPSRRRPPKAATIEGIRRSQANLQRFMREPLQARQSGDATGDRLTGMMDVCQYLDVELSKLLSELLNEALPGGDVGARQIGSTP